jgi:hypothetical protein
MSGTSRRLLPAHRKIGFAHALTSSGVAGPLISTIQHGYLVATHDLGTAWLRSSELVSSHLPHIVARPANLNNIPSACRPASPMPSETFVLLSFGRFGPAIPHDASLANGRSGSNDLHGELALANLAQLLRYAAVVAAFLTLPPT